MTELYHFTTAEAACSALQSGLHPDVTPGDPLQAAGVWLSPNLYGPGSPGSFFGAVGLGVSDQYISTFRLVYVGPNPRYPKRRRFLLLRPGAELPSGLAECTTPGLINDSSVSCEFLLLEAVPAGMIDDVYFGNHAGHPDSHSDSEHRRCLAYLVATQHPLVGQLQYPHSTTCAAGHGWWIFSHLRDWLAERTSKEGRTPNAREVEKVLVTLATGGESAVEAMLHELESASVWSLVTNAYSAAYRAATGQDVDLSEDPPMPQ